MARVYSSVRSCRILRSSTQHSVTIRLARRPIPAARLSGAIGGSTEAAGGAPGAAYVTDASFLWRAVREGVACVMPEHVVERGAVTEPGDVLPHDPAGDRIETDRRLVEHQQPGRVDQRLGEL